MSGTAIVFVRQSMSRLMSYFGRSRVRVGTCRACRNVRELGKDERNTGFCVECVGRSHIDADDDIGGES